VNWWTIGFLLSGAAAAYIVFGYPLLLALLARRKTRPVRKKFEPRRVTALLAVHNGEAWIRAKLESLLALDYPRELLEILVLSDGSTDRTAAIAAGFRDRGVEVALLPRGGKAQALNEGIARARGDILFFTDVRQPVHPLALQSLVGSLGDPEVGAVCGHVLFIGGPEGVHTGMYWRYEKWIRKNQASLDSLMAGTGCIYAMRRELAAPIPSGTLLDDSYLPLVAFFRGYRFVIDFDAIAYEYPTSLETEFRRKVRTLAGIYQLIGIFPALLGPGNRMWLHFVSYKLGRLLLPFALLGVAITSFGLPAIAAVPVIAAQALFYLLAVLDPWVPPLGILKRASSVARTFTVLMAASLCAVSIFFRPPASLWKETQVTTKT
jgi:cellulose synthase/poly-beta-1,6-N-acetylglucosamine synthase-like glycosyltransferase